MKILTIVPITGLNDQYIEMRRANLNKKKARDTQITVVAVESGPASIEGSFDKSFATPEILKRIIQDHDAYDGFLIHCFLDAGVEEARELTPKPVVGVGEASMCFAAFIGNRFAIISPRGGAMTAFTYRLSKKLGFENNLVSVRDLNLPVLTLYNDVLGTKRAFLDEVKRVIVEDKADTIIPGCGAFSVWAGEFSEELRVPVLNPGACGLAMIESLIRLNLSHSRLAYGELSEKSRNIRAMEYNYGSNPMGKETSKRVS